jgi:hypothetical protein
MIKLYDIQNKHKGQPAVILGGGPSLPEDLKRVPSEAVLFAVNDHAFHIGIRPDYMVTMDDPSIKPALYELATKPAGYLRVNELLQYTDIDMRGVDRPDARSGIFAAWLAIFLGCRPILLTGMDLYQGAVKYCHNRDEFMGHKYIFDEPMETHLRDWRKLQRYWGHQYIRAVSGPLVEIFGKYV